MHAISFRHCRQFLKITDDSIAASIIGHSAAAFHLMKCADFLCTVPCISVLSLWPLQASRQLEVCAAALPSAPRQSDSYFWLTFVTHFSLQKLNREYCNADTNILLLTVLGLIFGLITTDWLWKWAQARSVSHNRLECQWSTGVMLLIDQLLFFFF